MDVSRIHDRIEWRMDRGSRSTGESREEDVVHPLLWTVAGVSTLLLVKKKDFPTTEHSFRGS